MRVNLLDASTITICLGFSCKFLFHVYVKLLTTFSLGSLDFFALFHLSGLVHTVAFEDEAAALPSLAVIFKLFSYCCSVLWEVWLYSNPSLLCHAGHSFSILYMPQEGDVKITG